MRSAAERLRRRPVLASSSARAGLPARIAGRSARSAPAGRLRLLVAAADALGQPSTGALARRGRRAAARSRSARSRKGSTLPATCTTSSSSKQRTTCRIASTSRIAPRNWLPRPSPGEAPRARPAMSTNSRGREIAAAPRSQAFEPRIGHRHHAEVRIDRAERVIGRRRSRGLVMALKSVDLPTFGRPTMPQLKPMDRRSHSLAEGLPRPRSGGWSRSSPALPGSPATGAG